MIIELMEKAVLFGADSEYIMVSFENINSPNKLPAACKHYNIRHISMFEFFKVNKREFNIK